MPGPLPRGGEGVTISLSPRSPLPFSLSGQRLGGEVGGAGGWGAGGWVGWGGVAEGGGHVAVHGPIPQSDPSASPLRQGRALHARTRTRMASESLKVTLLPSGPGHPRPFRRTRTQMTRPNSTRRLRRRGRTASCQWGINPGRSKSRCTGVLGWLKLIQVASHSPSLLIHLA